MAQTTGIINGSDLRVLLAVEGGTEVIIDNLTDCSISVSTEMKDTTTKNNAGYKDVLPGMHSATLSFSAYYASDSAVGTGYNDLIDMQIAKSKLDIRFSHVLGALTTENAADERFQLKGYITSLELSGGTEDSSTYSCTMDIVETIVREAIS
tara:strand:- start:269 stop:724 length:456 start_codon:yes stop_codon:yes gene_type:complete